MSNTGALVYTRAATAEKNANSGIPETFKEHQFRIDGTLRFSIRKFDIADRNMYVRRFLPTDDINRYRQRF